MIKRIICVLSALAVLTISVHAQTVRRVEDGAITTTVPDTQGMSVGAQAAIVYEPITGRVLFAQNAQERLPIASTTKIMTALITLEQPDLDIAFTVNPGAIQVEGSSMGLQEGDEVTLHTLAAGMLLASGNDAANAAAVRIDGSVPEFVERMNRRAQELGLADTHFETPSGLDGDTHYSTASDLAKLAAFALQNDAFRSICGEYKMRVQYGNPPYDRWLTNHNKLLNYYEGTIGVKTGFTKKAGRCLVSAARRDGIELIIVTLDCPDDWATHQRLYDKYFSELEVVDLAKQIPQVQVPVTGGTVGQVEAVPYDLVQVPVPVSGTAITCRVTAEPFLYAPVRAGQPIGQAEVMVDGAPVANLTLVAQADVEMLHPYVEKKTIWERVQGWFKRE